MANFHLSPDVLARYQALRYDSAAKRGHMIVPLGTIYWADEHPDGLPATDPVSEPTIMRLLLIRSNLWRTGKIPDEDLPFWLEAQRVLPDWPGFQRLALSALNRNRDMRAEEDADSFFVSLAADSEAFWADLKEDGTIEWSAKLKRPEDEAGQADSDA